MYDHAVNDGLTFYETSNAVHWAAARGELVQLRTDHGYEVHRVAFPYVRPATLSFVDYLAGDYARALEKLESALGVAQDETRELIRKVMVGIFTELGADHPLAREYRRKLAAALY